MIKILLLFFLLAFAKGYTQSDPDNLLFEPTIHGDVAMIEESWFVDGPTGYEFYGLVKMQFDSKGNLVERHNYFQDTLTPSVSERYFYNRQGLLASEIYEFPRGGSMEIQYEYKDTMLDRRIVKRSGSVVVQEFSYEYHDDRMIKKTIIDSETVVSETTYEYDGDNVTETEVRYSGINALTVIKKGTLGNYHSYEIAYSNYPNDFQLTMNEAGHLSRIDRDNRPYEEYQYNLLDDGNWIMRATTFTRNPEGIPLYCFRKILYTTGEESGSIALNKKWLNTILN